MIESNLELVETDWKLKMFSTLKNWQHRIKEKEPEKVILSFATKFNAKRKTNYTE